MNFIVDNLLAEWKAKPMIVVMDCGYATGRGAGPDAVTAFEDVVINDLIPTIDARRKTHCSRPRVQP